VLSSPTRPPSHDSSALCAALATSRPGLTADLDTARLVAPCHRFVPTTEIARFLRRPDTREDPPTARAQNRLLSLELSYGIVLACTARSPGRDGAEKVEKLEV
jgi:hypothetical protein